VVVGDDGGRGDSQEEEPYEVFGHRSLIYSRLWKKVRYHRSIWLLELFFKGRLRRVRAEAVEAEEGGWSVGMGGR
jgi:hypothetical protein